MAGSSRQERAWVRGARDGSASDLEALFREHWPRAYRAAYLVVHDAAAAEDVAQEAFLAALRALDRFDRRRPFGPWLHRIVVNRAIDWARARSLRGEIFAEGLVEVAAPRASAARGRGRGGRRRRRDLASRPRGDPVAPRRDRTREGRRHPPRGARALPASGAGTGARRLAGRPLGRPAGRLEAAPQRLA